MADPDVLIGAELIMLAAVFLAVATVYGALRLLGWVWERLGTRRATDIAAPRPDALRDASPGHDRAWLRPEDYRNADYHVSGTPWDRRGRIR